MIACDLRCAFQLIIYDCIYVKLIDKTPFKMFPYTFPRISDHVLTIQ